MLQDLKGTFVVRDAVWTVVLLALLSVVPNSVSRAQDMDLEALIHRLDRLDSDLTGIQRRLAAEGVVNTGDRSEVNQQSSVTLPAQQESRLNSLEEQLRTLTGQVEQAQHSLDQAQDRINSLSEEINARFVSIEEGLSALRGAAPRLPADRPAAEVDPVGLSDAVERDSAPVMVNSDPNLERYDTMEVLGEISSGEQPKRGDPNGIASNVTRAVDGEPSGSASPEDSYDVAYQMLRRADYGEAEMALRAFIEKYPDHELAGNAFYWLGETFYVRDDYEQAAVAFARGYKNFPTGSKAPDNLLKLGISFRGMNQNAEACHTFAKLKLDHSDAPAVIIVRLEQERAKAGCQ